MRQPANLSKSIAAVAAIITTTGTGIIAGAITTGAGTIAITTRSQRLCRPVRVHRARLRPARPPRARIPRMQ